MLAMHYIMNTSSTHHHLSVPDIHGRNLVPRANAMSESGTYYSSSSREGIFKPGENKYPLAPGYWIVSNQVEIIYSSSRNSKETGDEIFRLFLLNCKQSSRNNLFEWSQFKRNRRNNSHFAKKKRSWNQALRPLSAGKTRLFSWPLGKYHRRHDFV
jgi:hypothetical protein